MVGGCGEEPGREGRPEAAAPASEPQLRTGLGALERYRPRANAPSSAEPAGRRFWEQLIVCCATGICGKRACEEAGCNYSCFSFGTERCGTPRRGRPAMRHCGPGCASRRRSAPLRPGHTDPRLHASAAPCENAPRIPGGAPLLPAAPPSTDRRRSRRHLIPAAPPPHWPDAPPRGPAPPGLPVTIGWRRYRLATIGRFERTTDDPRVAKQTHAPCAWCTMGVVGGSGRSEFQVSGRDCGLLAAPGTSSERRALRRTLFFVRGGFRLALGPSAPESFLDGQGACTHRSGNDQGEKTKERRLYRYSKQKFRSECRGGWKLIWQFL